MPGKPPYYKYYPKDIEGDGTVKAMTCEEFGAYQHLLNNAWHEEPSGSVPDDDKILSMWATLSLKRWLKAKPAVMKAFTKGDDGRWHQKRMEAEAAKASKVIAAKSRAGKASAAQHMSNICSTDDPTQAHKVLMDMDVGSDSSGVGGVGEGVPRAPSEGPINGQAWESWLAQEWIYYHRGTAPSNRDLGKVCEFVLELLRQGVAPEDIRDRIRDPSRDRTEATWQFGKHWKKSTKTRMSGIKAFAEAGT